MRSHCESCRIGLRRPTGACHGENAVARSHTHVHPTPHAAGSVKGRIEEGLGLSRTERPRTVLKPRPAKESQPGPSAGCGNTVHKRSYSPEVPVTRSVHPWEIRHSRACDDRHQSRLGRTQAALACKRQTAATLNSLSSGHVTGLCRLGWVSVARPGSR